MECFKGLSCARWTTLPGRGRTLRTLRSPSLICRRWMSLLLTEGYYTGALSMDSGHQLFA
eukprot:4025067-Amphidinium_carterae.1